MTITELSIKRPILIIVLFLIVILLGIFTALQLKYELLPKINTPYITIVSVYEGASPSEVENSITKKLEDAVSGVSNVKRVTSSSNEGYAVLSIEFLQDTDLDKAMQEVQRYVNQVLPQFPQGAKNPSIDKYSLSDLPVLRVAATSNIEEQEFFELLKNQIKPRLSQIAGVGRIQLVGGLEKEIKIFLDEQKLKSYHLSILMVVQSLQKANLEIPIGNVKDSDAQYGFKLSGKFSDFETIENLDVAIQPDGSKVKLKEIAKVEYGTKDTKTITRLNQKSAIGIVIQKQSNANAVDVSKRVRDVLKDIESENINTNIRFEIAADSSEFTLKASKTVFEDLLIAILLVALVMLLFLHSIRNALIVMLSIPTSLVFAFIGMWAMDFSLNLMTLLAMSLVIGILVDDSIVVLENIYRHLEMGKDKVKSSIDGRNEIGFSALSITLVIVVVFLPLVFVPGITGGIIKEFALVVVVSTLASLMVCFTLTPMLSSRFAKLEHFTDKTFFGKLILSIEASINKLTKWYVSMLKSGLKRRWLIYTAAFGSFFAALYLIFGGYIGGEFLPVTDRGEISVIIETPASSKFEETNIVAKKIEQQLSQLPEVNRIFSTVGLSNDPYFGEIVGDNQIELSVLLVDKTQRAKTVSQMSQEIRNIALAIAGNKVKVSPVGLMGAEAIPIQILISGSERDKVIQYANELKQGTNSISGTNDVRLSLQSNKSELNINIDRDRMASLGLELDVVAMGLRVAITGYDELKYREGNTEFPIRIQLRDIDRKHTSQIENLSFINGQGDVIYLKQFSSIQRISAPGTLERRNKNASTILFSKAVGKSVTEIGDEIKQFVAKNPPPAGVKVSYEGDLELAGDSYINLGIALIAGIVLVYLIMVALYNSFLYPFVVLFSIPVAVTGALLALALSMKTLNIFSIFGVIMMLGLVAKNAILIVDRANNLKVEGRNTLYALLDAGKTRLRPILMTTLAMVIGMLPLALQSGASGEYISAMALVLIGGLTSSMIFTVFIVPAIYLEFDRLKLSFKRVQKKHRDYPSSAMITTIKPLILFVGLLASTTVHSQTRLSLKQAEELVKTQNSEVKIKKMDIRKADWTLTEARSLYLPNINFTSMYTYNNKPQVFFLPNNFLDPTASADEYTAIDATAKNVYQNSLLLTYPLIQFENGPTLSNAKLNRTNSELEVKATESKKVAEVRKVYYEALWAKAQQSFWEETIKRYESLLSETCQQMLQGLAMGIDTLQAFVQVENIKPQLLKSKNAYNYSERQLKILLNFAEGEIITLTDSLDFNPQILTSDSVSLSNRYDLQQLNLHIKYSDNQVKIERAKLLPNLQFLANHSIVAQQKNFDFNSYKWPNSNFIGLQLSIPIFSGMRSYSRVKKAQIEREQAKEIYDYATRQASLEEHSYKTSMYETAEQINSQRIVLDASKRLYGLVYDRWRQGLVKQGELHDAQLALQQARLNYMGLVYQYLVIESELKRIRGL